MEFEIIHGLFGETKHRDEIYTHKLASEQSSHLMEGNTSANQFNDVCDVHKPYRDKSSAQQWHVYRLDDDVDDR